MCVICSTHRLDEKFAHRFMLKGLSIDKLGMQPHI